MIKEFCSDSTVFLKNSYRDLLLCLLLLAVALTIGLFRVSETGILWPDSSQYVNAAAMVRDWLRSGNFFHPYEFAKGNYIQYPAFHMPYHPPVYPGLLGLWFLMFGVSSLSARVFIAFLLAIAGCFFYAILRMLPLPRSVSLGCSLLMLSTPEIALWSRDTMSEIPALAFILAASYFFLVWIRTNSSRVYLTAFALAEMAFLSKVLTIGIIPTWLIWTLLAGEWRRFRSPRALVPPVLYLILNVVWIWFTLGYSKYETVSSGAAANYVGAFSWITLDYYSLSLPSMVGWITLIGALAGTLYAIFSQHSYFQRFFWLSWFFSYSLFVLVMGKVDEQRYFLFALPAVPGIFSHLFNSRSFISVVASILLGVGLISNIYHMTNFPTGVVGSRQIGARLAMLDEPGNILMSCDQQADFIFYYRSNGPLLQRRIIRGDRSLTIGTPEYAGVKPVVIAHTSADVLETLRRGRIRYIVTCAPTDPKLDRRTEEKILVHNTAEYSPDKFSLVGVFSLRVEYNKPGHIDQVYIWRFTGELPQGPSEIPVPVPTADMVITSPS